MAAYIFLTQRVTFSRLHSLRVIPLPYFLNVAASLKGISFSVESGKALGLLGRNGAGKTTTIRILMDVFHANSGELLLDGEPFVQRNVQIGYLPEERGL